MPAGSAPRCPTCEGPVEDPRGPSRPFCSKRCKLIDLGKWLGEEYRVAAFDDAPSEADGPGALPGWPTDESS